MNAQIIRFRPPVSDVVVYPTSAVILILPVVRVDRDDGTPAPHRQRRLRGKTADFAVTDEVIDGA